MLRERSALALTRSYDDDKPLLVRLDERTSRIEALGDEAEWNTSVAGGLWATAGYYAVRATVAREAAHARSLNLPALRSFFTHLLKNGYRLNGVPIAGAVDVDRPDDVKAAEAFLKQVGI